APSVFGVHEVLELPGRPVVAGRHRAAAADQQALAGQRHRSLRGDAGEGLDVVGLLHEERAVSLVRPDDGARAGVEGVQEYSHEGPDAGAEVDDAVGDDGGAAGGPRRDQPLVAQDAPVAGAPAELPDDGARRGVEAVEEPVVGGDVDAAVPGRRRVAHRTVAEEGPELLARARVVAADAVLAGRGNEEAPT